MWRQYILNIKKTHYLYGFQFLPQFSKSLSTFNKIENPLFSNLIKLNNVKRVNKFISTNKLFSTNSYEDEANEFESLLDDYSLPVNMAIETPLDISRVTIVSDISSAKRAVKALFEAKEEYHAVDTEVSDIDLKRQGPVGNGKVICASIYSGEHVDFGEGGGKILWIDNSNEKEGILLCFKEWFESKEHKKVWHNYGFDRHVLFNMGIDCNGFAGDTMHLARLFDSSRDRTTGASGYSLEALTNDLLNRRKAPMKLLFGVPKIRKNGMAGNILELPNLRELQQNAISREKWIRYSAYDAEGTWLVRNVLQKRLEEINWRENLNMFNFYEKYLLPFGNLLTEMERIGIRLDANEYLAGVEKQAKIDKEKHNLIFKNWVAAARRGDSEGVNPASSSQIQILLFGGAKNIKTGEELPFERTFKIENEIENSNELIDELEILSLSELKEKCRENNLKVSGTKTELQKRLRHSNSLLKEYNEMSLNDLIDCSVSRALNSEGNKTELIKRLVNYSLKLIESSNQSNDTIHNYNNYQPIKLVPAPIKKHREITIKSFCLKPTKFTVSGWPAVTSEAISELAGNPFEQPPIFGSAYKFFGGGENGRKACESLFSLCAMGGIDSLISNFVSPLRELVDSNQRIHCSLNLNTETGRLSARRPNLQNQPALEKDAYKIRDGFISEVGNRLIVADYGQLELRLLAHMTKCSSMLEAFEKGGCFHSRTAVGMFEHVRRAVEKGDVLLEWDYSRGKPTVPLLKDVFGAERRKAKVLNFSIAYGKTSHGLSKDWGVSVKEAEKILRMWYADRPEVLEWQQKVINDAKLTGYTRTLMGRYRKLPDINSKNRGLRGHSERAAINTPIQGGAADVVMMAMLKLYNSSILQKLGWKLLLQIHDEVILEGPQESVDEAMDEVRNCMENPFDDLGLTGLLVKLTVDAKSADTWYKAK